MAEPFSMGSVVPACYQWSEHGLRLFIRQHSLLGPDRVKYRAVTSPGGLVTILPHCVLSQCVHTCHTGIRNWVLDHLSGLLSYAPSCIHYR